MPAAALATGALGQLQMIGSQQLLRQRPAVRSGTIVPLRSCPLSTICAPSAAVAVLSGLPAAGSTEGQADA